MTSLAFWNHLFVAGLLFFTVVLMGKPRLPAVLRYFVFSSLSLAGLSATAVFLQGDTHATVTVLVTIVFKVILVPFLLLHMARRAGASMASRLFLKPASTYFLIIGILVLSAFVSERFLGIPFVPVALVLLGLAFMIIRRDLYSQVIGFLIMENGISVYAVLVIGDIPLFVETGIALIVTLGAFLMALLTMHVQQEYRCADTSHLTQLTD